MRRIAFAAVLAAFLASRVAIAFVYETDDTDLKLYAQYAAELVLAERNGLAFYDYHLRYVDAELAKWKKAGGPELPPMVRIVEYPPAAIGFMAIPMLFIDRVPDDGVITRSLKEQYKAAYRALMLAIDLATFLLLAVMLRKRSTTRTMILALGLYAVTGAALYHVVYDRLDLVLGSMVLAAIALVSSPRLHPIFGLTALALAFAFKVAPVILFPLWVMASISFPPNRKILFERTVLLAGLFAAAVVPFYLASGPPALEFLAYHSERGLQIESAWASLLMLLSFFGHEIEVVQGFGSYNLSSSLAPLFAKISTFALAAAIAAATISVYRGGRARGLAANTVLFLLLGMIGAKVLSPQYLLWLVPLVPLTVDTSPRAAALFIGACVLTTIIFPHYYPSDVARLVIGPLLVPEILEPTSLGKLLIIARNAVLIAQAVLLMKMVRAPRSE